MRKLIHLMKLAMFFGGVTMFFVCALLATYLWRVEDTGWVLFASLGACSAALTLLIGWVYPRVWDEI